ncbi:MAG TPA: hypothetical protein VJ596_00085 [Gemmatimonadaceae bacterium]|nr:hypothetical protein [Gemmatimonadaceae bacterium]
MSPVHIHLVLNHLPVVGLAFITLLLLVAFARRSGELTKVALAFLAVIGAVSVAVFLTGEPAEEAVEMLDGVSEAMIESHEEVALIALIAAVTVGAIALATLVILRKRTVPRWVTGSALVLTLAVLGVMGVTANSGGQIRHSEIRASGAAARGAFPEADEESVERDH